MIFLGGIVHKNYSDVKDRMENSRLNEEKLKELLIYVKENVPFYAKCNPQQFESYPIITKNNLKENWKDFHSVAYEGPIHFMATSGSTGTPFTMEWDMGKRKRQLAELIYFNELAEQKLGQPYIYFRVWTDKNRKSQKNFLCRILRQSIFCI